MQQHRATRKHLGILNRHPAHGLEMPEE